MLLNDGIVRKAKINKACQYIVKPGSHMLPPTWDMATGTAWDNAAAYLNINL